ncbi:type I signal peptidase [Clostridium sp. CAG:609]|nr:type I signal peptidase [Clostridium sp. CAG:609]
MKNKNIIKIILGIIKSIATFFIVCVFSIIFLQRVSNNSINLAGFSIYTVVTESMYPKYKVYDMILVKSVDTKSIKVHDDVVYKGEKSDFQGKIVTHRVEDITEDNGVLTFTTKGINNDIEDPLVNENQIMGKVVHKLLLLSLISKVINNTYGFYFLIFVPLVVVIFLEVMESIEEKKELNKVLDDERKKEE